MPESSSAIVRIFGMAGTIILSQSAAISARLGLWSGWGPVSGHEFEGLMVEWGKQEYYLGVLNWKKMLEKGGTKKTQLDPFRRCLQHWSFGEA
jgi:hypothetical protein